MAVQTAWAEPSVRRRRRLRLPSLSILLVASALMDPARACPTSSATNGLDGSVYTCSANDADGCAVTPGELHSLTGTFATPERTGSALAGAGLSLTVKCAEVAGQGPERAADGLTATVRGCYGTPFFSVGGSGAVVVVSTVDAGCAAADCTCSYSSQPLDSDFAGSMSTSYVSGQDANGDDEVTGCSCTCRKYSCARTIADDGKKGEVTTGNALQEGHAAVASAGSCVIDSNSYGCSGGYLDGQTYTAYTEAVGVTMADASDTPKDWSSYIGGSHRTSPAVSSGVYTYSNLFVNALAIHNKELTLTFTATGTAVDGAAISATKGTFKAYPSTYRFIQAAIGYPGTVSNNPQYTSNCVYTVGAENADLGVYAVQLLDSSGNVITTIDKDSDEDKDFFRISVKVRTGKNDAAPLAVTGERQDSSKPPTSSAYTTLDPSNVIVTLVGNDMADATNANADTTDAEALDDIVKLNSNLDAGHSMRFKLNVADQVGNSYNIFLSTTGSWLSTTAGATTTEDKWVGCSSSSASFRINSGDTSVAFGPGKTLFTSASYPRIIRADTNTDWANYSTYFNVQGENGLPAPLHVLFRNAGGSVLQHANCYQCVQARLFQCSDSLSAKVAYPYCSSDAQALCTTSSTDGNTCSSHTSSGHIKYLDTLSGTTVMNLINGTATFTDLKIHYVFGAGYRLKFMLNAGLALDGSGTANTNVYAPATEHVNGVVYLPDTKLTTSAYHPYKPLQELPNSFFVRPHHMDVYQQVGGDGVDLNNDNVPDGVGQGVVFRVQPAVVIVGDGYKYNKNWNTHGWTPVTAAIKQMSCTVAGEAKDCATRDISMYGRITKPVWHSSKFTAATSQTALSTHFSDRAYYLKTDGNCDYHIKTESECLAANALLGFTPLDADGSVGTNDLSNAAFPPYCFRTPSGSIEFNAATNGPTDDTKEVVDGYHALCRVHGESPSDEDERDTVQISYTSSSLLGGQAGMIWKDLRVYTNNSDVWQGDIVPEFRVGPGSNGSDFKDTDIFTGVMGDRFDVFVAPDPPTNLRVTSYNHLGFRVEFEPSEVSRAQPLSGFIIEVDMCSQVASSNASCSTMPHPAYQNDPRYTITSALGTDLSAGGGMTVDVLLNFTNPTPGQVSPMDIYFKPDLTLQTGDSIAFNLGRTFRMLGSFVAVCELEGPDGHAFEITNLDQDQMVFHLKVKEGVLTATKPVYVTFPVGCGITIPGDAANEKERSKFGIYVNPLPSVLHAPVIGAITSRRFDNCKGTGADLRSFESSSGCDVTATYVLSSVQDANSMDIEWDGQLQRGGKGVACADTPLPTTTTPFPSNRLCSSYSAESKCKDIGGVYGVVDGVSVCCSASCGMCSDQATSGRACETRTGGASGCCKSNIVTSAVQCGNGNVAPCLMTASTFYDTTSWDHGGDNGKPIGSNPGSGNSAGSSLGDSNAACRSGTASKNPCTLTIGQDWTIGVNTSYDWKTFENRSTFPASYPRIGASFIRDRALAYRDIIEIKMAGLLMRQPLGGVCHQFAEKGALYGQGINPVKNSTATTHSNFTTLDHCELFVTEVYLNHTDQPSHPWESYWDVKRGILSVVVGTPVPFETKVEIFVYGFQSQSTVVLPDPTVDCAQGSISCQTSLEVIAEVRRARKTSVLFTGKITGATSGGATTSTYATKYGEPVQSYTESAPANGLVIDPASIFNFRVYAYNGRFKSKSVQTLVQNRAIQRPDKPQYFPQVMQESLPATMIYTNLQGTQTSSPLPGVASPTQAEPGATTRIGVKFTPTRQINELETLDLELPKFNGPGFLAMANGANNLILADDYQPVGTDGCTCDAGGRILTPRNNYKITRAAEGSASCSYIETNDTIRITGTPLQNGHGLPANENISAPWCACGDCACELSGMPITPKAIYNTTGNCTDPHPDGVCQCDENGVVATPPVTYNSTGNCSSCACDANGQSSYVAPYAVAPKAGQADSLIQAEGACFNCTCDSNGAISLGGKGGNCSLCMCAAQACDCQCQPRICGCQCPIFRKCTCGCDLHKTYTCGCNQNKPDPIFSGASWSTFAQTLVLTVGPKKQLAEGKEHVVWISSAADIKMPLDGSYPMTATGLSGLDALLMRFKLNWISVFPSPSAPRLGFIIQFTSDLFWKTNVQTMVVPDNLDGGVIGRQVVAVLGAPTTLNGDVIKLSLPARYLNGRYIEIDGEIMKVLYANATHPHLKVRRGEFLTSRKEHPIALGGDGCGCDASGNTTGGAACQCNGVKMLNMGATDFSVNGGLDFAVGPANSEKKCRMLSSEGSSADEGCNILDKAFPYGIKTHQSAYVSGMVTPSLNFASACAGTASTCTSGNCACQATGLVTGGEFANQRPRGNASMVSSGNPMDYPVDYRTRLSVAAAGTADVSILAVQSTDLLVGKYIRLGDEIMFVKATSRAVLSVLPFRPFGSGANGQQCSCSVTGTVSGGGTCQCLGNQGTGCQDGGELYALGGGGQEFRATFTVADGKVNGITVVSPGFKFLSAPDIKIKSGGTNCADVEFHVTLTDEVMRVVRGQLGTTISAHASNAIVNTVLWPSQSDSSRPGRRYSFRVAAYNSAGFSDFNYYDLKLYAVEPKVLPAAGSVPIEIHLVGGGLSTRGYTVYIGRLANDGSVDLAKSKKCTALVNLDPTGTRLRCKAPAWVGAKFDLIVHYKSGIFEQIATGNSWIKYAPPEILSIKPNKLDPAVPKTPVTIEINGRNFGLDSADVVGGLIGKTPLPCNPLIVKSDQKILCTLTPVTPEDSLEGDIQIMAGNTSFHGRGQMTELVPGVTNLGIADQPLPAKAKVQADFTEVTSSPAKTEEFKATFTSDLVKAAKSNDPTFSAARVNVTGLEAGSVIVLFSIMPDTSSATAASPAAVALNLAVQAADPNSVLRQGTLTSSVEVTLPAGVEDLAAQSNGASTGSAVPLYFSSCEPKTYNPGLDMKRCYNCCTYLCQTGQEVPQVGGTDVLPGFRAQTCQRLCLTHCGYSRERTL